MTGRRSKNHHFVPKALQRNFCFEGERIWYSQRQGDGVFFSPVERNIQKTFRKRNLYTVLDEADQPSDEVERIFYGRLDDFLGKLIPEFLDHFSKGVVPNVVGGLLTSVQNAVFDLLKRTPEFIKTIDDLEVGSDLVESILKETRERDFEKAEIDSFRDHYLKDNMLEAIGRDIRVRATLTKSQDVENALRQLRVRWARTPAKNSFILSSMIAYRIGNGGRNGLSNPAMEIWLPISPKVAMVLLRDPSGRVPLSVDISREKVREINIFAARNSRQIASHSKELIQSLI